MIARIIKKLRSALPEWNVRKTPEIRTTKPSVSKGFLRTVRKVRISGGKSSDFGTLDGGVCRE